MSERKIDYDEGVLIKQHPGTGMDVFMYVAQPGKYLDAHLNNIPDALASEAGYNVEQLAKARLRQERKLQANAIIDKELSDDANTEEECVDVLNGFRLVSIGMGRHNVKDPDGNLLNAYPLPKEGAQRLFHAMADVETKAQKSK